MCVRYGDATSAAEIRVLNQKLRKAIENEGRDARIEGLWWQFSLTERSSVEPSAVSLLRVSRDRDGAPELTGRAWQEDGTLSARYWSEAAKERKDNGPATRMLRSWKGPQKSGSNQPIARPATGQLGPTPIRKSTRARPVCTYAPMPRI